MRARRKYAPLKGGLKRLLYPLGNPRGVLFLNFEYRTTITNEPLTYESWA